MREPDLDASESKFKPDFHMLFDNGVAQIDFESSESYLDIDAFELFSVIFKSLLCKIRLQGLDVLAFASDCPAFLTSSFILSMPS